MQIFDAASIRKWDTFTIKEKQISSIELMETAAEEVAQYIITKIPKQSIYIFCGPGNNGGDGLAIARLLANNNWHVKVFTTASATDCSSDYQINLKRLPKTVNVLHLSENFLLPKIESGIILDSLFGSGLNRPLSGRYKKIVQELNSSSLRIISIDIPSGLFATDNSINDLEAIIKAHTTLTFQCPKMSFFYADYARFVGDFDILNIELSQNFQGKPIGEFIEKERIKLKDKETFDFKGDNGYLTLIAGNNPMQGAAVLAAKAAFKMGCGYVGWLCHPEHHLEMLKVIPEAILLQSISPKSTAIAIGPGLGTDASALDLLKKSIRAELPLVLDADALTLISKERITPPKNSILTPHLGELQKLIGKWKNSEECLSLQKQYAQKHEVFLLQKGAYSKLCTPNGKVYINSTGNSNMAKAGMGDTLTGMIGSLLAQGYNSEEAVIYGVFLHGLAGDLAAKSEGIGLLASNVAEKIPTVIKELKTR